ncbi:peptide-methionine (S)-S-oxide reductase MsrA [Adlercreutzia sp. ZJ304]|uniref:peptide-methionine (S)-S-oxide reductase MsrA n=1 Tax=Adlercreutzia sp. ZJ304 TaxID=2709791 RepID=UPI0013EC29E9|nr:peptide-methionine (S)-S-oxide reductase MsrA [Adlercreutzia sp. ZJ304]
MVKEIYLAGGCFWGTQAYIDKLPGVLATETGYANATTEAPTYEEVCTGDTNAAECVRVEFDPNVISPRLLLQAFLRTIDPTSLNRQGNDSGTQYRTGIYWTDSADCRVVSEALEELQQHFEAPIVVEAQQLQSFFPAEDYHQEYLRKNPGGYCHVNLADARQFISEHASEFGQIKRTVRLNPTFKREDGATVSVKLPDNF